MLSKLKQGHWPIFILGSLASMANLYLPIFLARVLTPEQMGTYKIFFLHMAAIPYLFLAGGPLHSVYYWVGKDEDYRKKYIQQAYLLGFGLSVLILILGLPLTSPLSQLIKINENQVSLLLLGSFLSVPTGFYGHAKIALGSTAKGSLFDASFELAKVCAFIYMAMRIKDISHIFMVFCLVFGLKFFITLILKLKDDLLVFRPEWDKLKEIFRYCLPISLAGLATFFVDKMDQFVLAGNLSNEQFAFYSMGCLMIPPLYTLEMSVTSVLIPKLAQAYSQKSGAAKVFFKNAVSNIGFLLIPSCFGLFLFANPIINLLYTDKFSESAVYLKIFSLTYLIMCIPYDAVPRATGNTKWILRLTLAIGSMSLMGVLIASNYLGAPETLAVAIFFKLAQRLTGLFYSAKILETSWYRLLPIKSIMAYTTTSILLSLLCLTLRDIISNDLLWLSYCAPSFALLYLGTLYFPYRKGFFNEI